MSAWRIAQLWTVGLLLLAIALFVAHGAGALDWLNDPVDINRMR